jgi:hypothetical protein
MKVYLGCPIDHSNVEETPEQQMRNLAGLVVGALGESTVCYNPFAAFLNAENAKTFDELRFVVEINNFALRNCDAAVFVWNGSPSFGVPVEIDLAVQWQRRFFVWNRTRKPLGLYIRERAFRGNGVLADSADELVRALVACLKSDGASE